MSAEDNFEIRLRGFGGHASRPQSGREVLVAACALVAARLTWWVSDDGRGRWRRLRTYYFQEAFAGRLPRIFGLAGRFGAAPGGGVLVGDFKRTGHFFSEAEIAAGAPPDWTTISTVHY